MGSIPSPASEEPKSWAPYLSSDMNTSGSTSDSIVHDTSIGSNTNTSSNSQSQSQSQSQSHSQAMGGIEYSRTDNTSNVINADEMHTQGSGDHHDHNDIDDSDPHSQRIEAAFKLHPTLTPLMRESFRRMYKTARRRTNECCTINNPNALFMNTNSTNKVTTGGSDLSTNAASSSETTPTHTNTTNNADTKQPGQPYNNLNNKAISHPVSSHYAAVTPTITHHYPGRLKEDLGDMKRGMISSTRGMTGAILWGEGLQVLLEGDTSGGLEMMAHAFLTGSGKGIHCVLNPNGRGPGKAKVEMTKNMDGVDACEAALLWVLGPDERGWAGGEYGAGFKKSGQKGSNGDEIPLPTSLKCERVVLDGLMTKQELNGRVGVAFGEVQSDDRRKVKLDDDGRTVKARPGNIFPMSSALIVDALAVASFLAMLECRTSVGVQLLSRALLEVANSEYTTWRGREGTMGRRVSLLEARCGCFTNLGLFENAIEDVEEALHLSPGSPGLVYIRAQTLRALARDGDVKMAAMSVREMERFLELATATGGHENEVDALYCASMWAFEGIGRTDRRAYAHEGKRLFELAQRAERDSGEENTSEVKRICEVYMSQTNTPIPDRLHTPGHALNTTGPPLPSAIDLGVGVGAGVGAGAGVGVDGGGLSGTGRECHYCQTVTTDLKNCSKCKTPAYCGVECQRADWPRHRKICWPNQTHNITMDRSGA